MKSLAVAVLLISFAFPTLAGTPALVRLEGWVVDSYCRAKNANAEGKDCILECHEKGAALIFVDKKGTTYGLDDQQAALEHVGRKVGLFGTVDEDRNLKIGKFIELADGAH